MHHGMEYGMDIMTGMEWIRMDCNGMDQIGMDQIGMDQIGMEWNRMHDVVYTDC